jgi:hypothetical protein
MRDMVKKVIIIAMSSGPLVSAAGAMIGEAGYCQVGCYQNTKAKAVGIRALPCWQSLGRGALYYIWNDIA